MENELSGHQSAVWEARDRHRLPSTGSTVEELCDLIAVPPKIESVLCDFAKADPRDACWVFPALRLKV